MYCIVAQLCIYNLARKRVEGQVVAPEEPYMQGGYYWGYSVRVAASLSDVFNHCPYAHEGGYDCTIGTSDKGQSLYSLKQQQLSNQRLFTFII